VGWEVKREMLRGVTADGREVALTPKQLYPIPYQMVVVNMQKASGAITAKAAAEAEAERLRKDQPAKAAEFEAAAKAKQAEADRIVLGLMEHYNNRRTAGKHDGPELIGLRLYQVTWPMDTKASAESKSRGVTAFVYEQAKDEKATAALKAVPYSKNISSEFGDDSNPD
ncbi:MAG TPA: hypothetical protein VF796_11605, partial [Humisphaera sp.]